MNIYELALVEDVNLTQLWYELKLELSNVMEMAKPDDAAIKTKDLIRIMNDMEDSLKEIQKIGEKMNDLYLDQMQGGMRQ